MDPFIRPIKGDMGAVMKRMRDQKRGIQKAIRKIVSDETKPLRAELKQAALSQLPKRGGLNKWAARTPQSITDFREKFAGIKIRYRKKGHDMKALDRGRVRHPIFGNRDKWTVQSIRGGFFTNTVDKEADPIRRRIAQEINKHMNSIGDGL